MEGFPSGQREQTVNLLSFDYGSSNLPPSTKNRTKAKLPSSFFMLFGDIRIYTQKENFNCRIGTQIRKCNGHIVGINEDFTEYERRRFGFFTALITPLYYTGQRKKGLRENGKTGNKKEGLFSPLSVLPVIRHYPRSHRILPVPQPLPRCRLLQLLPRLHQHQILLRWNLPLRTLPLSFPLS